MKYIMALLIIALLISCSENNNEMTVVPEPKETIDLGTVITEDMIALMMGDRWRNNFGFTRPNSFEVVSWTSGSISGQNSYYTFFNHGGPHVDAPIHYGMNGGLEVYTVESFTGPLRVFDVSEFGIGRTVDIDVFQDQGLNPGDIVLIYTNYKPPAEDEMPQSITLTREAAEYLAEIPVRAYGTDSYSVESRDPRPVDADTELARAAPVHEAFLSKQIPIYEQLNNVDQLLDKDNMVFTGVPLIIEKGDGMIVHPVVFVY
jgi:kynurenine formamidase